MTFKLPIRIPVGKKPVITQRFASKEMLEFYKSKGISVPFHNGVDFVIDGSNREIYGLELITPSDGWTVIKRYWYSPMSTNGNGIVIQSPVFEVDGTKKVIELRFTHCSEVPDVSGTLKAGTVIGYIGNSGAVNPPPTTEDPYAGTHLHLGCIEYDVVDGVLVNRNINNGVYGLVDPLIWINANDYDSSPFTSVSKDAPPLAWSIEKQGLTEVWQKIVYVIRTLFK